MRRTAILVLAAALATPGLLAADDAAPVVCGAAGLEVTVGLAYDHNTLGKVAATYIELDFAPPLQMPLDEPPEQLRKRLTGLLPPEYRVTLAKPEKPRVVRVALTTSEAGIPPRDAFRLRLDCPPGTRVARSDVTCATGEVVDASGLPMAPELAANVSCLVARMDPAASGAP